MKETPYAIPFNTDTQVIFITNKFSKKQGISEDQLPQTWDELETVAHKLDVKKAMILSVSDSILCGTLARMFGH